ncbi:hypothetical protein E2562_021155 [Oryza meyeriana var. granulata]|uniref:No apical meristem-associated C-terminal domain-containing protein n=1 Tax=Oryza meyeriana var. granulata TaxID=110450 RepID=A0A6G1BMY5_9ORYZ|nr:hypothetical protein E2562_021155 [Oryza meyeriana var. granulata]
MASHLSQSSIQLAPVGAQQPFLYAHAPFPLFSTQPPPVAPAVQVPPASSGSGQWHRVAATPKAVDEANKRMYYTHEEDLRLVSAWLNNSTDPIEGNARKGETYWTKVAKAFNATTPDERKREVSHLKGHWHKTTKKVSFFNGCYIQLRDAYASGRSDLQLMDQALELYRTRQGQQFTFTHWWKAVADSPKWNIHVSSTARGPKRHTPDLNRNPKPMVRPIGIKRAKKGKGTADEVTLEVREHLQTLVQTQASQKEELEGIKDLQQKLSDQRVEAATLQLKAAQENKEAKQIPPIWSHGPRKPILGLSHSSQISFGGELTDLNPTEISLGGAVGCSPTGSVGCIGGNPSIHNAGGVLPLVMQLYDEKGFLKTQTAAKMAQWY